MKIKPRVEIYADLIKDHHKINAWTDYNCFSIEEIEKYNLSERCVVIDIIYSGTEGDNFIFRDINIVFNSFMLRFLRSMRGYSKILFEIGQVGLKSRIRSYKGLVKGIDGALEQEFDLENGYSIFGGIINVNETHFDKINIFDREATFLMVSKDEIFSIKFLRDCFSSIINNKSYTINYAKACHLYCKHNNVIIREGGDGGDQEFTWQLFVCKEDLDFVITRIKEILRIQV